MTNRDDMVLPVDVEGGAPRTAREAAARRAKAPVGARRRGGLGRKLAAARQLRRLRGAGGAGVRGGGLGRFAARGGPVLIVAAIIAAITLRLASGKTFKNLGQLLNDKVLGDMDDNARAVMKAKMKLFTPTILRGIAQEGGVSHLVPIIDDLKARSLRTDKGRAIALRHPGFTEDSPPEQLIMRGKSLIEDAFYAAGGQKALDELTRELQNY